MAWCLIGQRIHLHGVVLMHRDNLLKSLLRAKPLPFFLTVLEIKFFFHFINAGKIENFLAAPIHVTPLLFG
jgi:hypothetical protein